MAEKWFKKIHNTLINNWKREDEKMERALKAYADPCHKLIVQSYFHGLLVLHMVTRLEKEG